MDTTTILQWEGKGFLFLLGVTLALKLLTRQIRLDGLFARKDGTGQVSPERIQLLLTTIAVSLKFISDVKHSANGALPDVSAQMLYVFGASSGIYAGVKALTNLKSNQASRR